jgi:membrane-associated phospholipid phosphatase
MAEEEPEADPTQANTEAATPLQRVVHAAFNGLVFGLCYLLANQFAAQRGSTRNVALPLDAQIPFLPWMLLPYLSSGPFFVLAFFAMRGRDRLRVLSQRMLVATVLAALVFMAWPLRFSAPRPAVDTPWLAALFDLLATIDLPYNQLPSLHVAFCVVWWAALRAVPASRWVRMLLAGWLGLTAVATLFTHQHHLLDVLAGLGLGLLCVALVKPGRTEPNVALCYLVAGGVAAVVGTALWPVVVTLYLVASLWLVALAYWRGDRHFLHKHGGRHPLWTWCLYAPYLVGYRLTWLAVLLRGQPPLRQIGPRLWIGRRLRHAEATLLPPGCTVIDLSAELPEAPALRRQPYLHFPLLDIVAPPPEAMRPVVAAVRTELDAGRCVYLHCAMGLRRCVVIAERAGAAMATSAP